MGCHYRTSGRVIFPLALATFHTVSAIMDGEALPVSPGEFQHCRRFVNWVSTNIPPLFDIPLYRSNGTSLDRAYFCLHPISFLPRFLTSKLAGLVIQFFCIHLIAIYFCSPGGISSSWFSYTSLGSEPCLSSSFSPSYFNPTPYLAEEENGQTTTQEPP